MYFKCIYWFSRIHVNFLYFFIFFENIVFEKNQGYNRETASLITRKVFYCNIESCHKKYKKFLTFNLQKFSIFFFFKYVKKIEKIHMNSVKSINPFNTKKRIGYLFLLFISFANFLITFRHCCYAKSIFLPPLM